MVVGFVGVMGLFLVAAAFVAGPVRAFAVDRFGPEDARVVWVPAFGAMVTVGFLLPLGYGLADLARQALGWAVFQAAFVSAFFSIYLAVTLAPAWFAWANARKDRLVAGAAAGVGTLVYLVLIYPVVNFVNSCFLGFGVLLPAGCN